MANTFAYKKLLREIGRDLVDQGVLSRYKKRLRLTLSSDEEQAQEASLQYSLKSHLREVVLAGGQAELADKVLLAYLFHADLLRLFFTVGERKIASKWTKKMIGEDDPGSTSETLKTIVTAACAH